MSSSTQRSPVATLYPSTKEDVNTYLAAIRLAVSVRIQMEAEKAGGDDEKVAMLADSYGRHHPNLPPRPSVTTTDGRGPVPILNQTSSTQSASNTTKRGFAHHGERYPLPSHSVSTATTSTGATLEALEQHRGYFPPPEPPVGSQKRDGGMRRRLLPSPGKSMSTGIGPMAIKANHSPIVVSNGTTNISPPIGSTPAPPRNPMSKHAGPLPIALNHDLSGIPSECQLYATNADVHNLTFAVCSVTNLTTNHTQNLTSRQLQSEDLSTSHTLAIHDNAMCKAPKGFEQRLACHYYDGWFVLAFFLFFSAVVLAWISVRKYGNRQPDEEENGTATWPGHSKASTNNVEAKLRAQVRKAHYENRRSGKQVAPSPAEWERAGRITSERSGEKN